MDIKEKQKKIPHLIETAEAPLRSAAQQLKEMSTSGETLVKERRDRERDLEIHEAQVEKLRARLTELKTNKEYQAHLFEIEMANKKKGEIEEQILTLMERVEKGQQETKQAQTRAKEAERLFVQEKTRLRRCRLVWRRNLRNWTRSAAKRERSWTKPSSFDTPN